MIEAYVEGWQPCSRTLAQYIDDTTHAKTPRSVVDYVRRYVKRNVCNSDVRDMLFAVLSNRELLAKTHVVWDGSGRSCVILVRPDGYTMFGAKSRGIDSAIQFYLDNAETLFLNMTDETWAEVNAWLAEYDWGRSAM